MIAAATATSGLAMVVTSDDATKRADRGFLPALV